jgi:hypothetical protein
MDHARLPILYTRDLYLFTTLTSLSAICARSGCRLCTRIIPQIALPWEADRYVLIESLARVSRCPESRPSTWVHDRVERLTDAGKPLIPGTGLPVIERVLWRDPGRKGYQDQIGQGAHKRLMRRSQLGQRAEAGRSFLQRDARRQPAALAPGSIGLMTTGSHQLWVKYGGPGPGRRRHAALQQR